MRPLSNAVFVITILVCPALGQPPVPGDSGRTQPTPAPDGPKHNLPSYVVGLGGGYNRYTDPAASILIGVAVRIGHTRLYSWTTIDTPVAPAFSTGSTPPPATIRTGAAVVAARSGSCFLFFLGDAGIATSTNANGPETLSTYSGGGGMYCDIGPKLKTKNLYIGPVVRTIKVGASAVLPVFELMLGKGF